MNKLFLKLQHLTNSSGILPNTSVEARMILRPIFQIKGAYNQQILDTAQILKSEIVSLDKIEYNSATIHHACGALKLNLEKIRKFGGMSFSLSCISDDMITQSDAALSLSAKMLADAMALDNNLVAKTQYDLICSITEINAKGATLLGQVTKIKDDFCGMYKEYIRMNSAVWKTYEDLMERHMER